MEMPREEWSKYQNGPAAGYWDGDSTCFEFCWCAEIVHEAWMPCHTLSIKLRQVSLWVVRHKSNRWATKMRGSKWGCVTEIWNRDKKGYWWASIEGLKYIKRCTHYVNDHPHSCHLSVFSQLTTHSFAHFFHSYLASTMPPSTRRSHAKEMDGCKRWNSFVFIAWQRVNKGYEATSDTAMMSLKRTTMSIYKVGTLIMCQPHLTL